MVQTFSIVAIVGTAVQKIARVGLHLLPTGYNAKVDAVSDYGVGRWLGPRTSSSAPRGEMTRRTP
jgi:hypothetical protein